MKKKITFNTQDLMADGVVFSLAELGCFIRLATQYWVKGYLPTDTISLSRIAGCSVGQFQDAWVNVKTLFYEDDNILRCRPIEENMRKARERSIKAKNSADTRWHGREAEAA